ncbi:methylmalonyl-CoA mutase OS=Streptomyces alboniger OX=132473 GN=CP975_24760 PE=4 SV=1 [Streptomyces alboniger]
MEETGVANVADPLGGSWFVEQLTDRIEADAEKIFEQIKERGLRAHPDGQHPIGPVTSGILRGIEDGWFTGEIAESAFQYQRALEKGDKRVVGVNVHHGSVTGDLEILRVSHEVEREQVRALGARRAARDEAGVRAALDAMLAAARDGSNMIEPMLDAVRAEATLGEVCGVLRDEWGVYTEPAGF